MVDLLTRIAGGGLVNLIQKEMLGKLGDKVLALQEFIIY